MTVRHKVIEKDGKKFLTCRGCGETKELTEQFWHKDKGAKLGFVYRCKDCVHKTSKVSANKYRASHKDKTHEYNIRYNTEHRDEIREKRRGSRERENIKRRERMKEISKKTTEHQKEMGYGHIHQKVSRLIRNLGIRPTKCPICGYEGKVVAHHPDYNKIYEIVFCCPSCHRLIHNGEITEFKIVKLCSEHNGTPIINCMICGEPILQIASTKYCTKCKPKVRADNLKRRKEKHLFTNKQKNGND